jgi:hypothetical protein
LHFVAFQDGGAANGGSPLAIDRDASSPIVVAAKANAWSSANI